MANKIYTKTTSTGTDDCLIIDHQNAWRLPFDIGDDWTKIHVGMFWSWIDASGDNVNYTGGEIANGSSTNDTWGYMGFTRDTVPIWLPDSSSGYTTGDPQKVYAGLRFNKVKASDATPALTDSTTSFSDKSTFFSNLGDRAVQQSTTSSNSVTTCWFPHANAESGFASYIGFDIEKTGSTANGLKIRDASSQTQYSDVSIDALKSKMGTSAFSSTTDEKTFLWTDNSSLNPQPFPNSFFLYNPFTEIRPRIHSFAVKKIS